MSDGEATKEITLDSVRGQLRFGIFWLDMQKGMSELEGRLTDQDKLVAQNTIYNMVAFGVASGLFANEESDDWIAAVKGEKLIGPVFLKYGESE